MTSVMRNFAVSLITLLILSSTSYTGQATKLIPDDSNEESDLAYSIEKCLKSQGIVFKQVSVTKVNEELSATHTNIEVVLNADTTLPVSCNVINAIRLCTLIAVNRRPGYSLTISVAPSNLGVAEGSAKKVIYTGTVTDPDSMPPCIDVLALKAKGTLSIKTCNVEREVSDEAKRLGVKIEKLNVKVKKDKEGKLHLLVSGKASALNGSESRFRGIDSESQIIETVKLLVKQNTGVQMINTDNLKVLPTKR